MYSGSFYKKYSETSLNQPLFFGGTNFCIPKSGVWFNTRFPTLGFYLTFGLNRILVYSGFGLDRFIQDYGLFRVWFRQVYTRFWFIQIGLDRILVYSGFGLDRFIQGLV